VNTVEDPILDAARSQFDRVWTCLAQTQNIIAESRQVLAVFYRDHHVPYLMRSGMICLFCDYEAANMNRLNFGASDHNRGHPDSALSLILRKFGICDSCVARYGLAAAILPAALNRELAKACAAQRERAAPGRFTTKSLPEP